MRYNSEVVPNEKYITIATTGKEPTTYPNAETAYENIGHQKFFGILKGHLGTALQGIGEIGLLLSANELLLPVLTSQEINVRSLLQLATLTLVSALASHYMATDGLRDLKIARSREYALLDARIIRVFK